jgi:diguanylate cyclase (GGDEF)-like protein
MSVRGPGEDEQQLKALKLYDILDTAADHVFDRIVCLAKTIAETQIAAISLIGRDRQWFKASEGLPLQEMERSASFCAHTIEHGRHFIVEDAASDLRFFENPLVLDAPHVRFYAGFPLRTPDGHAIGALCVMDNGRRTLSPKQISALADLASITIDALELRELAACDSLTGGLTRKAFATVASSEVDRTRRCGHDLSCVVLDVDHFKNINDSYGHAAGDHALRMIAAMCREEMRAHDTLCRYGGEEFVILLPETDETGAFLVAERIRSAVCACDMRYGSCSLRVTLSGGVACWMPPEIDIEPTFVRADAALYRAKVGGRNMVARASDLPKGELARFRAA